LTLRAAGGTGVAFLNLTALLAGLLPGLSPLLAQQQINSAWRHICGERLWSFLVLDGVVICPPQITAGAAAITQYSPTVSLNIAASAALLAQATPGAIPGITNVSIRFGTSPAVGQIYNIIAADVTIPTAIVLTLDRPVVEATTLTAGYQVYRPYITPPIADFLKWESLSDFANGIVLANDRLNQTSKYFDMRDPQRAAQGIAYYCGNYVGAFIPNPATGAVVPNPNVEGGTNLYELWPHPTAGQTFYAKFRRRGSAFVLPTDTQPGVIPDDLIVQRALGWHGYPFAMANVANFPTFKGANWTQLVAVARMSYEDQLRDVKRADEEAAPQQVWNRGHGLRPRSGDFRGVGDFPIDANYLQSHLVRF
jgi:hypothetical protein